MENFCNQNPCKNFIEEKGAPVISTTYQPSIHNLASRRVALTEPMRFGKPGRVNISRLMAKILSKVFEQFLALLVFQV
jgi:hypothetical protein